MAKKQTQKPTPPKPTTGEIKPSPVRTEKASGNDKSIKKKGA
jgi:hypothetical protein